MKSDDRPERLRGEPAEAKLRKKRMNARRNNFDALRLLFAALVIFSHSFALLGDAEPVIWGRTVGNLSVHGFFVISGYLIVQSFGRSRSLLEYGTNRFLRIVPGLVVALLVSSLIAARLHSFVTNPVPYISNGPVWTLTWEVACYAAVVAVGIVGALTRHAFPALFAAGWIVFLANIGNTSDFVAAIVPLFLMFAAGALFAVFLTRIRLELLILAVVGLAVTADFSVFSVLYRFVTDHVPFLYGAVVTPEQVHRVIYLACFPVVVMWIGRLTRPTLRIPDDISYGMYIYGWPVAQVLVYFALKWDLPANPLLLFIATLVITAPVAFLSWRLVERPALRLKRLWWKRPAGPAGPAPAPESEGTLPEAPQETTPVEEPAGGAR